jgi:hypothetical protein
LKGEKLKKERMTMPETNELISIFVKSLETAKKNHANVTPTK